MVLLVCFWASPLSTGCRQNPQKDVYERCRSNPNPFITSGFVHMQVDNLSEHDYMVKSGWNPLHTVTVVYFHFHFIPQSPTLSPTSLWRGATAATEDLSSPWTSCVTLWLTVLWGMTRVKSAVSTTCLPHVSCSLTDTHTHTHTHTHTPTHTRTHTHTYTHTNTHIILIIPYSRGACVSCLDLIFHNLMLIMENPRTRQLFTRTTFNSFNSVYYIHPHVHGYLWWWSLGRHRSIVNLSNCAVFCNMW